MKHNKAIEVMEMLLECSTFEKQLTAEVPRSAADWDKQIYLTIKDEHDILFDNLDELHTFLSGMYKYKSLLNRS